MNDNDTALKFKATIQLFVFGHIMVVIICIWQYSNLVIVIIDL